MGRKKLENSEGKYKQLFDKQGLNGALVAGKIGISQGAFAKKMKGSYTQSFSKEEEAGIEKYLKLIQKDISAAL